MTIIIRVCLVEHCWEDDLSFLLILNPFLADNLGIRIAASIQRSLA